MEFGRRKLLCGIAGLAALGLGGAGLARAAARPDRRALAAAPRGGELMLAEAGRQGRFLWVAGDRSREIEADPLQGVYVASLGDPIGREGAWVRQLGGEIQVDWFGARGDGVANDTDALNAAAKFLEHEGGGTLAFSDKVYLVGRQAHVPGAKPFYRNQDVVRIRRCPRKVTIAGNGAVLRCAPGLRFGSFDPHTGLPARITLPFADLDYLVTPFTAAILLEQNSGGIEIRDIEIDGRIQDAVIGGMWGESGWQVPHHGISLNNNRGTHLVRNVHAHHLGTDGIVMLSEITTDTEPAVPTTVEDSRFEYNGRQGTSVIGGKGIAFRRCKFNHIGRIGVIQTSPGAGVDLEAEWGIIRDILFEDCEFDGNTGAGLAADSGDGARIVARRCRFIGARNYALWPNKPDMEFRDCLIVGGMTGFFSDPSGERAPKFYNCRFSDDPRHSSTGKVYAVPIEAGASKGAYFDNCDFVFTTMPLPHTQAGTRYHNCRMSSPAPGKAQLAGIFTGRNVINGGGALTNSVFQGETIINGSGWFTGSRFLGRVVLNGRPISRPPDP
jgi:hypothetical protein